MEQNLHHWFYLAISMITPYQIKNTYPIIGFFDTVTIVGTRFVVKLIQLLGSTSTPYIEILNTTNASLSVSLNSVTQTLTLSNLSNLNVILYFITLKKVIYDDYFNQIGTIDIENSNITNVTLGTSQQVNITATNDLNVFPGCCGITNVSSLGNVNVMLATGGWPNVTVTGENITVQVQSGVPNIFMKAKNTAILSTAGVSTCRVEAGHLINIDTKGVSTIYAKASTMTTFANMTLTGISTVYMGISNGTKIEYSCPKIVTMNTSGISKVYVCATEKIYVNGYGGDIYYQGGINDTRGYGSKTPFVS